MELLLGEIVKEKGKDDLFSLVNLSPNNQIFLLIFSLQSGQNSILLKRTDKPYSHLFYICCSLYTYCLLSNIWSNLTQKITKLSDAYNNHFTRKGDLTINTQNTDYTIAEHLNNNTLTCSGSETGLARSVKWGAVITLTRAQFSPVTCLLLGRLLRLYSRL